MGEAFRAQAAHCDLSVVFQLISAQWLTGRLLVESELALEATIECAEGLPVGASCGGVDGLLAFYEAFLVPQVQFTFFAQDVPAREPLGEVMVLLLEACRRVDEWRTLSQLRLRTDGALPEGDRAALRPLWDALDGARPVGAVVEVVGLPRASVVDPLRHWVDRRLAAQAESSHPPAVETSPSVRPDTVAVLARGRAQVRSGDVRAAIASFQEALALDPHHLLAQQHLFRLRELHPDLFAEAEA